MSVAKVILLCAKQDLALCGHKESAESLNRGNFLESLHILAEYDPTVKQKLNGPHNATYFSMSAFLLL